MLVYYFYKSFTQSSSVNNFVYNSLVLYDITWSVQFYILQTNTGLIAMMELQPLLQPLFAWSYFNTTKFKQT